MCRAAVTPEAAAVLVDLLHDVCVALDPEHPELVVIGPVDFGQPSRSAPQEVTDA